MGLVIVPAAWIVRRGHGMHRYGDHWHDAAFIFRSGSVAYIEAWTGRSPTNSERRELAAQLAQHGITHVQWTRIREDGLVHTVLLRIARDSV